jgi:hypothetical protein
VGDLAVEEGVFLGLIFGVDQPGGLGPVLGAQALLLVGRAVFAEINAVLATEQAVLQFHLVSHVCEANEIVPPSIRP